MTIIKPNTKHKNKHLTRIYIYLDLLEYLILHNKIDANKTQLNNEHSIKNFQSNEEINELFLEVFGVNQEDIQVDMYNAIIKIYKAEEDFINKVREQFQHRHTIMMDREMIILINLALAEYLTYKLDKKLIIKIYVDLAASFQESTEFIHGVLDKSLDCIIYMNNKNPEEM